MGDVASRVEVLLEGLVVQGPGRSSLLDERDGGGGVLAPLHQGLCDHEAGTVVAGVAAHENSAVVPYGLSGSGGQLLERGSVVDVWVVTAVVRDGLLLSVQETAGRG